MKRARYINDTYIKVGSAKGHGVSSDVFCAERKEDKCIVAIKRLKEVVPEDATKLNLVPREVSIMQKMSHPNIARVIEIVKDQEGHAFIVMDWMQHDLRGLLCSHNSEYFSRAQVKGYANQFVRGIAYCHAANYMHLDLKPENILISKEGEVKLGDFGLAEVFDPTRVRKKVVVSRWYRPLEVYYGETHFTFAIDMWSVGCIIGELLLNHPLLPGESDEDQMLCIYKLCGTPVENGWPEATTLPKYIAPPQAMERNLNEKLRMNNKTSRASYFTKEAISLLESILCHSPSKRASAVEVLNHPFFTTEYPKPLEAPLMPRFSESYFGTVRKKK